MSMSDGIKSKIAEKEKKTQGEEELRNLINSAASKSMKQFIKKLDSGEIPIDNMSDFIRVMGVYREINNIEGVMDGDTGEGSLPELNIRQERAFKENVSEGTISEDEEGNIDTESMSPEELTELIKQMDTAQNKHNEEAF